VVDRLFAWQFPRILKLLNCMRGVVPVQILDEKNPRQEAAWFM